MVRLRVSCRPCGTLRRTGARWGEPCDLGLQTSGPSDARSRRPPWQPCIQATAASVALDACAADDAGTNVSSFAPTAVV